MKNFLKVLIPGVIFCVIIAYIFHLILREFNLGLPFLIIIIEGAIVGLCLSFLLRFAPDVSANKFWILTAIFAIVLYIVPEYLNYLEFSKLLSSNPEFAVGLANFSFLDFLGFSSTIGSDFGRIGSSISFRFFGIGYWVIQLVETFIYVFGMVLGMDLLAKDTLLNVLSN